MLRTGAGTSFNAKIQRRGAKDAEVLLLQGRQALVAQGPSRLGIKGRVFMGILLLIQRFERRHFVCERRQAAQHARGLTIESHVEIAGQAFQGHEP
jgi:hypothetical protein